MTISYDPAKPSLTLATGSLDFEDARLVFEGANFEVEDKRKNYGEKRIICLETGRLSWATPRVARTATFSA